MMRTQTIDPELSIIIVSFSTRKMTIECLRSIDEQTLNIKYEVIVVDNNSTDDSVSAVRAEFPRVRLIALPENVGFARANNLAAKEARGRRILLLNPDTVILDCAIDRLFAFANSRPSCQIWGGRTLFEDGSLNPFSCWRKMTLWSLFCSATGLTYLAPSSQILSPESYGGWKRDTVRCVDIVTGCFLMINRALWDKLNGFDPKFFMFGEEADLCLRARLAGACPIVTPTATIVHYGGASTTSFLEQRLMLLKGRVTLLDRHWSTLGRPFGRLLFLSITVTRWWGYYLLGNLSTRSDLTRLAEDWRTLWQRRTEWIGGYGAPGSDDNL